jgi:dipeptidyl aminopeptidase/acylaminoacyl peptidase
VLRAVDRPATISKVLFSQEADGLWTGLPPLWSADERTIYVGRYQRGSARLYAIDLQTRRWQALTPDTLSVSHYALANDGRHLLAVLENANQPRELYRLDPATRALTRLTHEGKALSGLPVGRVDTVQWRSRDGRFTVHGFLVKPASYDPKRRYPLIVAVHGGPGVFYTNSFMGSRFDQHFPPAQLLAASGYLVLLPNPRGDTSYGPEFQAALNRDLASGPFHDVDSGVSALVERGLVDSTSIGILGASYGAYLTAYAITQTHRYVAAAIDDGPINLSSLFAHEYAMETMSLRARLGGTPWSHPKLYASQSPITFVDRIKTPVLMRYGGRSVSAADAVRSSFLSQGFEFYAGLKESNVPVEFVLHPDQGHGIADWHLYRDWVDRTLAWFGRWMPRRSNP